MRILLLGSTGILGTSLVVAAESAGAECVELGHQELEITDYGAVESAVMKFRPDAVINCVAVVGINPCEEDPETAFQVNTTAPLHLARACAKQDITLIQPSTHAVFDGMKQEPYTEDDLPRPTNIYSASKYAAECLVSATCRKYYIVRLPTMFGTRRNSRPGFFDKATRWIRDGKAMRIAEDKFDSPSYALDVASEVLRILRDEEPYGLYHVANTGNISVYEAVVELAGLLDASVDIERVADSEFPSIAHKPLRSAIASKKVKPLRGWREALRDHVLGNLQHRAE